MDNFKLTKSVITNNKINNCQQIIIDCQKELKEIEEKKIQIIERNNEAQRTIWNSCLHEWDRVSWDDDLDKYRCRFCQLSRIKSHYFD